MKGLRAALLLPIVLLFASCADPAIEYYNLGIDAAEHEDWQLAADMWRKAIEYRPEDPDANYNLGMALIDLGDPAGAEPYFRTAVANAPEDPETHYGLGRSLELQGRFIEACNGLCFWNFYNINILCS